MIQTDYIKKPPIQHLLARLKAEAYSYVKKKKKTPEGKEVICFHCEGLENADKFSCLGLSYTETSCRLLNLHVYQPGVGRRF